MSGEVGPGRVIEACTLNGVPFHGELGCTANASNEPMPSLARGWIANFVEIARCVAARASHKRVCIQCAIVQHQRKPRNVSTVCVELAATKLCLAVERRWRQTRHWNLGTIWQTPPAQATLLARSLCHERRHRSPASLDRRDLCHERRHGARRAWINGSQRTCDLWMAPD